MEPKNNHIQVIPIFVKGFRCLPLCLFLVIATCYVAVGSDGYENYKYLGQLKKLESRQIDDSVWGVDISSYHGQTEIKLTNTLGVKWARIFVNWREGKDQQEGYKRYEEYVNGFVSFGIQPIFQLFFMLQDEKGKLVPGNQLIDNPELLKKYFEYLKKTVLFYKDRVHHWEIWNEPNSTDFWQGPINARQYARIAKVITKTIKRADPAAKVAVGAFAGVPLTYMQDFLEAQPGTDFDAISFHPYRTMPEDLDQDIDLMNKLIGKYTRRKIELWATEFGYPTSPEPADWTGSGPWSEDVQATWLIRRLLCNYAWKIKINNYFALADIPNGLSKTGKQVTLFFGLTNLSYKPKPSFFAYQNVISLVNNRSSPIESNIEIAIKGDQQFAGKPRIVAFGQGNEVGGFAVWLPLKIGEKRSVESDIVIKKTTSRQLVLINPADGKIYLLKKINALSGETVLPNITISENPIFLFDRKLIKIEK